MSGKNSLDAPIGIGLIVSGFVLGVTTFKEWLFLKVPVLLDKYPFEYPEHGWTILLGAAIILFGRWLVRSKQKCKSSA